MKPISELHGNVLRIDENECCGCEKLQSKLTICAGLLACARYVVQRISEPLPNVESFNNFGSEDDPAGNFGISCQSSLHDIDLEHLDEKKMPMTIGGKLHTNDSYGFMNAMIPIISNPASTAQDANPS